MYRCCHPILRKSIKALMRIISFVCLSLCWRAKRIYIIFLLSYGLARGHKEKPTMHWISFPSKTLLYQIENGFKDPTPSMIWCLWDGEFAKISHGKSSLLVMKLWKEILGRGEDKMNKKCKLKLSSNFYYPVHSHTIFRCNNLFDHIIRRLSRRCKTLYISKALSSVC